MIRLLLSFALLFSFSWSLHAQKQIGNKEYAEILWGKDEEFDTSDFPDGSFIYHTSDFILARGKLFSGNPPASNGEFDFEGKQIKNSGEWNNEAVKLALTGKENDRSEAKKMFLAGVRFDPQFFPFRYNLGRLYSIDFQYKESLIQFEYAKAEMPEYFKTYLHIGILSEMTREVYYAIDHYKIAVKKNPYDTEALIRLSDHYISTGLKNRAFLYLNEASKIQEASPNVKLGYARIEMEKGNYHIAYKIFLRTSLTSQEGKPVPYDKKFHYYFAETASKVTDYEIAEREYTKMLSFPNDPFFASVSAKVIARRRDIARKFAEAKRTQLDDSEEVNVEKSE
jgi:tetratricopeptide (TPR) repeat protein